LGLVVESDRHECHCLGDAHAPAETPADQISIAAGHQNPRARDGLGGADQRFQVVVGFADRMAEEGDRGGVARNAAHAFHDTGRALRDGVRQLAVAFMTVDAKAKVIA
jgi:hypothetical protein